MTRTRLSPRSIAVALAFAVGLGSMAGCRSSPVTDQPEEVFRRWNELAIANNPKARMLVCADTGTADSDLDPITNDQPGFPVIGRGRAGPGPPDLYVTIDGPRAVIDFTDPGTSATGDEEDIFVTMVKERRA